MEFPLRKKSCVAVSVLESYSRMHVYYQVITIWVDGAG